MSHFWKRTALTGLLSLSLAAGALADKYQVDAAHSSLGFSVTHLQMSEVDGRFKDFSGEFDWNPKALAKSSITFTAKASSITTDNDKRDEHLRGSDFFDVEKFPTLTFKSTGIKALGEDRYSVSGNLTVHGVTKPVTVQATIKGPSDPMKSGKPIIGFRTTFKINRMDYGVGANWKGNSDSVVSHAVFITIKGEAGVK